jgi:hypothetical protein
LKGGDVLSSEEVLHQWGDAAETLQDGVHVARVAQVPQTSHTLWVWLALIGLSSWKGVIVICALCTVLVPWGQRERKHLEGTKYMQMAAGSSQPHEIKRDLSLLSFCLFFFCGSFEARSPRVSLN